MSTLLASFDPARVGDAARLIDQIRETGADVCEGLPGTLLVRATAGPATVRNVFSDLGIPALVFDVTDRPFVGVQLPDTIAQWLKPRR
jgi:hypothetical protein